MILLPHWNVHYHLLYLHPVNFCCFFKSIYKVGFHTKHSSDFFLLCSPSISPFIINYYCLQIFFSKNRALVSSLSMTGTLITPRLSISETDPRLREVLSLPSSLPGTLEFSQMCRFSIFTIYSTFHFLTY
jgi:hypothetical protein